MINVNQKLVIELGCIDESDWRIIVFKITKKTPVWSDSENVTNFNYKYFTLGIWPKASFCLYSYELIYSSILHSSTAGITTHNVK